MIKNKFLSFILVFALFLPCAFLFVGCGKGEQANTIEFSGWFQESNGTLHAKIDNLEELEGKYIEYSDDLGENWWSCDLYNWNFF